MSECYIFSGSEILNYSVIEISDDSYVICADAGYLHAKRLGIVPDCIIGDFDTFGGEIPKNIEVIRYRAEKDDTDTMLAVKLALEKGYTDICIYGALGGRFDHTIANVQTLQYIYNHGRNGRIISDNDYIMLQGSGTRTYSRREGYYFSLLSISDKTDGITTEGLKYNLKNATLTSDFPLGVSNQILNEFATITVKNGLLLVIFSKDTHKKAL
ncbi:MAG: thiamine diphosphokinase [Clostridiales bacterium]|nr:thiamine diphosphokinase [Clostridiales bacterium]